MAARFSREDVNTGSNRRVRLVCKYVLVDSSVTIMVTLLIFFIFSLTLS